MLHILPSNKLHWTWLIMKAILILSFLTIVWGKCNAEVCTDTRIEDNDGKFYMSCLHANIIIAIYSQRLRPQEKHTSTSTP